MIDRDDRAPLSRERIDAVRVQQEILDSARRSFDDLTMLPGSTLAGSALGGEEPDIEHSPDGELDGFRERWRERRRDQWQVLTPINVGPVEQLRDEVQQLSGRIDLLRSRVDIADAAVRGLRRSMRLTMLAVAVLAVAVVVL